VIDTLPPAPADARVATGPVTLRYEDVNQQGQLQLVAMAHALGELAWPSFTAQATRMVEDNPGVYPILSRMVFKGGDGPISVFPPLSGNAWMQPSHAVDAAGSVERLFVNIWIDLDGVRGNTHPLPVERAGEPIKVGQFFAEYVITRLFTDPAARRVRSLRAGGVETVPPARYDWQPPQTAAALPEGATPLEPLSPEPPICFGFGHTDPNQHVNSLVYMRLFEDAVVRRLGARVANLSARWLDVAYRKPCFAGERVQLYVQPFQYGERLGAVGIFAEEDAPPNAPARCYIRMLF
jgi:hypothetical protein